MTVQLRELNSVLCGDLNGKEIQNRGDVCICVADPLYYTGEINTTLYSSYTPIKIFKNEKTKR